jgi:WD40 repeat protein
MTEAEHGFIKKTSPREIELQRVFENFDINREGHVDLGTLVLVLKELGITSCIYTARRLLETLDINQSGLVEFDDFKAFFEKASDFNEVRSLLSKEALKFVNYKEGAESGDPNFSVKYRIPHCHKPKVHHVFHSDVVQGVVWVGAEVFVSGSLDGKLAVWEGSIRPSLVHSLIGTSIYTICKVPDCDAIITGHSESDTPLNLVNYRTGDILTHFKGTEGAAVTTTDCAKNHIVAGLKTGKGILYDLVCAEPVGVFRPAGELVECVSILRETVATADHLGRVSLYDIRCKPCTSLMDFEGSLSRLACLKWTSEFDLLTGGDDYIIRRFDVRKVKPTGGAVGCLLGHSSPITSLTNIGYRTIFSGSTDGSVRVWEIENIQNRRGTNVKFVSASPEESPDMDDSISARCALIGHAQAVKGISVRKASGSALEVLSCSSDTTVNEYSIVL